jgi:hypothetical protein
MTQQMLADKLGLSRKTINEAEALGANAIDRRTDLAVRSITATSNAHTDLITDANEARASGDYEEATILEVGANLLTGSFVPDERTLYNLARTAGTLRLEVERLTKRLSSLHAAV